MLLINLALNLTQRPTPWALAFSILRRSLRLPPQYDRHQRGNPEGRYPPIIPEKTGLLMQKPPEKSPSPHFGQLTLAGLLGGLSALAIVITIAALLFPGNSAGPYQERGSGRNEIIIGTEDKPDDKPAKSQRTEIATIATTAQTQTTTKPATDPPNPGKPRRD